MQHAVPTLTSAIPASAATPNATIPQGPPPVISPTMMPSQVMRRPIDPKSPLSEGIQQSLWPKAYKPITLPKFNGKTDPHQFIMSYEAAVAFASEDDTVLAKSFVIAAEGDALAWYSMLKPSTVYFLGEPPGQDIGKLQGASSTVADFHISVPVQANAGRDTTRLLPEIRATKGKGTRHPRRDRNRSSDQRPPNRAVHSTPSKKETNFHTTVV